MKNYEKPVVLMNEDLTEGVYADSGDACYTASAYIHQVPETGRGDYRIQCNGVHNANHNCDGQIMTISFNQAVEYQGSNGQYLDGSGTSTIRIEYHYWNNYTDNIGLGDVIVTSDPGLAITGISIADAQWQRDFR